MTTTNNTTAKNDARNAARRAKRAAAKLAKLAPVAPKFIETTEKHWNGVSVTNKRPGVLAVMLATIQTGTKEKPVTKSDVLAALQAEFPERDVAKMKATIAMWMPAGIRAERKIILESREVELSKTESALGYWIDAKATAAYRVKIGYTPKA